MHILAASTCSVFAGFFDRIQITFEGNFRICKCLGQRKSILAVVSYLGKKTRLITAVTSWEMLCLGNSFLVVISSCRVVLFVRMLRGIRKG